MKNSRTPLRRPSLPATEILSFIPNTCSMVARQIQVPWVIEQRREAVLDVKRDGGVVEGVTLQPRVPRVLGHIQRPLQGVEQQAFSQATVLGTIDRQPERASRMTGTGCFGSLRETSDGRCSNVTDPGREGVVADHSLFARWDCDERFAQTPLFVLGDAVPDEVIPAMTFRSQRRIGHGPFRMAR